MPNFDKKFQDEKRVSALSGKMFNRLQREYIGQFPEEEQLEYYTALDKGTIGKMPENIPDYLH